MKVVVYQKNNQVILLTPTPEALASKSIEEIAATDVPKNCAFLILDSEQLPSSPQESWELVNGSLITNPEKAAALSQIQEIDMRRARLALLQSGLLDDVENAIAAMTGDEGRAAQINWEYATVLRKDDALVQAIAAGLGLTDSDINQLFALAATL